MNLDSLNKWLMLAANLGVLVGIFFLVVEIDQNTTMIESQVALSRADTAMTQASVMFESEYLPRIMISIDQGEELNAEEFLRFTAYMRSFNRNLDYVYSQYEIGLLGDETLRSLRMAVTVEIAEKQPALEIWERTKGAYSDGYIAFVESVLSEYK